MEQKNKTGITSDPSSSSEPAWKDRLRKRISDKCSLQPQPPLARTSDQEDQSGPNEFKNQKRDSSICRLYCKSCKKSFRHRCSARPHNKPDLRSSAAAGKSSQNQTGTCNISMDGPGLNPVCPGGQHPTSTQLRLESLNNYFINPVTHQLTTIKVFPQVYLCSSNGSPIQAFPVQLDSSTISSNQVDLSSNNFYIQQATQSTETAPPTNSSNEKSYVLSISEI